MLVVYHNTISEEWHLGKDVRSIEYTGEAVVAIDPSKTNMAVVVGTPDGHILDSIEFSGNNRRNGPVMDNTLYCQEIRSFLSEYLSKVQLYCVGCEEALTYKGVKQNHVTNMVLTEIRSNILNFFIEKFGIRVIEVNNWSWKYAILPEGYRSKYEKGSKKWFRQCMPDSPYSHYFEADMTDCLCIFWYLVKKQCNGYVMFCNKYEPCSYAYNYMFYPMRPGLLDNLREVKYNTNFTIEENISYYVNRIVGTFTMVIDVDCVELEDIYKRSSMFLIADANCSQIRVVAGRK